MPGVQPYEQQTRWDGGSLAHLKQFLMHGVSHFMHQALGPGLGGGMCWRVARFEDSFIRGKCWARRQTLGGIEETGPGLHNTTSF